MRAFLAVPVEQPAKRAVQALLSSLQRDVAGVRWARDDALHITVHFFGSIDADAARRALEAVRPAVSRTQRFPLTLDELGTFPARGVPRVLWLGGSTPAPELLRLAATCRSALQTSGFDVEQRPYRPHCTLGRPRGRWPAEDQQRWRRVEFSATSCVAESLVLYESLTRPDGAVHVPLERLTFAPDGPAAVT